MDTPGFEMNTDDVEIQLVVNVTHQPGAIRLDGYPHLVYAPKQLGPGVRTVDTHIEVERIYHAYLREGNIAELARGFETDEQHIREAIAYARSTRTKGE